jgi:hypothetical protein
MGVRTTQATEAGLGRSCDQFPRQVCIFTYFIESGVGRRKAAGRPCRMRHRRCPTRAILGRGHPRS